VNFSFTTPVLSPDGTWTIEVKATDAAENENTIAYTFTLDTTDPFLADLEVTSPTLQYAPYYNSGDDVWEVYETAVNITATASDATTYAAKMFFDRTDSQHPTTRIEYQENDSENPLDPWVVTVTVDYLLNSEITTIQVMVEDYAGNATSKTVRIKSLYAVADKVIGQGVIGVDGGTVACSDGTQVVIPAGAIIRDTLISIRLVAPIDIPRVNDSDLPDCIKGTHFVRRFQPEDLVFLEWVEITMPYHEGEIIRRGLDESKLAIFSWDGMNWNKVGGDVDEVNNTITVMVNHLGLFRIMEDRCGDPDEFDMYLTNNPFSPNGDGQRDSTVFVYKLPDDGVVTIKVYDLAGDLIKVLADAVNQDAGYHEVTWTGENDFTNYVGSGIYIFKLYVDYGTTSNTVIKPVGVIK